MEVNVAEKLMSSWVGIKDSLISNAPGLLVSIIILVILHFVIRFFLNKLSKFLIDRAAKTEELATEKEKRVTTINNIFKRVAFLVFWGVGLMILLGQIGVNIAPILTGVGIFGLTVSFGAQTLVKDIIAGIFILIENQIRVGDVAIINGVGGLVEEINLRTTVLRDLEGIVHVFSNGSINTLSNMTKEWSACVLDINIAYKEDPERVMEIMRKVEEDLRNDEEFRDLILEPMEIFGLDSFADSSMVIKGRIKTLPLKQWTIARQYRIRLKKAFDENKIEIPFPHISLYFGEASKPFEVLLNKTE
jgi:small-conductance mechanosensitive channel